jgi:hypothetical protein
MTGKHVTVKVYGGKGKKGTYYAFFYLKKKVLLPVVVRQRPSTIMTNNTRLRGEGDDVTAKSREAKWASEAHARQQESQIAQMHVTMLQQQAQMRLHQEAMLLQRNKMARLGYQGNANNNTDFGQQVMDVAGLAFAEDSIPSNINLVGDDVICQDYGSPKGNEMDDGDLQMFGNIP